MKKKNKRGIVNLIILVILLIAQVKVFKDSRANNVTYITANIIDAKGLLSTETSSIIAVNDGENGMAIVLPDILNTKRVSKYIVTKKEIITKEDIQENVEETTSIDNTIATPVTVEETLENYTVEQINVEETTQPSEQVKTEIVEEVEMLPGEKVYLTQEETENLAITLKAEYDTIEVNSQTLFNRKISYVDEDEYELLVISGYMPQDATIQTNEIDITDITNEILEKYPESFLIGNYNIKLISNEKEYIAKDFNQKLNIEITIVDGSKTHYLLEVKDNEIKELEDFKIENGKLKLETEKFSKYLVLEMQNGPVVYAGENTDGGENTQNSNRTAISVDGSNPKLEINDFESDKNYYLGLNYTEGKAKENSGKYTESNLKEVTVNYYGYNYNATEFGESETKDIALEANASLFSQGSIEQSGSILNRTYTRTDTISCTIKGISALHEQYSKFSSNSSWTIQMDVPNENFSKYFSEDNTDTANSSSGISVRISDGKIIVKGLDSSALQENNDTWTFSINISFSASLKTYVNNISYTNFNVNSFTTTIIIGEYVPYGTISDTELKTLISYKKCIPVDSNGNISVELIDNPFMNRPKKCGFNGWKTNDTKYSNNISTNANTFVQTLNVNLNNIKDESGEFIINLYPDWIEANVIFVSDTGDSANSGTSPDAPVNNNWSNIKSKITSDIRTCKNASNREVNIIVLMSGTLDVDGLTDPNIPYTLTSLYNGVNYKSTSTYLNVGTTNVQLDSDLQLDYIYVNSSRTYSSPGNITTDGTSAITPCLYGNMYNVRVGRGVSSTNNTYCTWAQVQGGYYNHSSSEYRLILESGLYYTVQLYRADSLLGGDTDTTANATIIVGNDIDRINNDNNKIKIYNRMASKTTSATATPYSGGKVINTIIKSGTIGIDYFNSESTSDDSERNYAGIYVGGHGSTGYDKGDRYLLVEGGNIANIIGGLHVSEEDMFKTYMYVKDGNVLNITGGAGYTHTYGDRIIQVTGGCVKYSISGGSNGVAASSTSNNGQLTGEALIYIGGTAQIGAAYTQSANGQRTYTITNISETLYGVNAGCVCGGANGNSNYAGQTDASYIIIDGNAIIHNNVYGGGNYGVIGEQSGSQNSAAIEIIDKTSSFTANTEYFISTANNGENGLSTNGTNLTNQTISTSLIPNDSGKWTFEQVSGNEYYLKNTVTGLYLYVEDVESNLITYTAKLTLSETNKTAFTVEGTTNKTITYKHTAVLINITLYLRYDNGWTMTNSKSNSSLYLLDYEKLKEEEETQDAKTVVNIKVLGGNVKNNIYGGANQNNIYGTVDIDMNNGTVNGTVYGGSNILGTILGSTLIDISGGQLGIVSEIENFDYSTIDRLFCGGLGEATNVQGKVVLSINDRSNTLKIYGNVYGGSSLGKINGNVNLEIKDAFSSSNTIFINGYVFGGGKGNSKTAAIVEGSAIINIDGSNLPKCNVFGGSNINGNINGEITVNVGKTYKSSILGIYGGGNQANIGTETEKVYVYLLENADVTNAFNGGKAADLILANENDTTRGIYLKGGTVKNLYGGSDSSGTVTASHIYIESGKATNIFGGNNLGGTTGISNISVLAGTITNIYGGGNQVGVTTTNITTNGGNIGTLFGGSNKSGDVTESFIITNNGTTNSKIETVYGGNNEGGTTKTTNITINGGGVGTVYGGGNHAVTNVTNININGEVTKNIYGGGNQAGVNTNTNITLTNATVGDNVYGGGNQGTVTQNTYVKVKDSTLKNSLYAGGNGASAVVYGNVNLTMEGNNKVTNNVFGGGNQAATGTEATNNSRSTVNIVGATIGGNVYGGANTSVVYGWTQTNIGYDTVGDETLKKGDIHINGTVFGGGEANASGSEIYDFDFISVTVGIDIQIDGNGHENFAILGSIFGSGNASSTSGTSYITIKNYGTSDKPQSNISLQRADCATIINSALSLSGATDRTNEYSGEFFSISRVTHVKLKNNSTLYLCNNANLLNKLESVVDVDGEEVKGTVTINEETGETTRNVDNRIYMLETKNLNIALNEKATIYGQVEGMFFFGLFTNRNNPATSAGFYHKGYNNGDEITNAGTFVANSYVKAEHLRNPEHDIKVDGFYTNYDEEGIIKTNYIKPTPDEDIYYMWIVGKSLDVTTFELSLIASKYATMGTAEQSLDGFSDPNIRFSIIGFSAGLSNGISLVDSSLIENIQQDEEIANTQFGLSMKTGNMGWQTKGETSFYTAEGGSYAGTTNYNSDNSNYTPTLNFYFYNSQNLTIKQTLGEVKIRLQAIVPVDDLNDKISIIDINLTLTTNLFPGDAYEAAITPGQEFGLFTTTDTTITSNSAFSVYYSLLIQEFSSVDEYKDFETYNRVLVSRDVSNAPYVFPLNTKITMLDMATDRYYYYVVTQEDITNGKYIYAIEDFIEMGSSNSLLDETELFNRCYDKKQDLLYENYIFHVNFADSDISEDIVENSLLMELRNEENQTILGVLGIQRENIVYTVHCDKSATIKVGATIEPKTIYLGDSIRLNVNTSFTQALLGSKTIYDTQYFDKKLGIKISVYDSNGNRLNSDSLFGINFELDGQYYYPRIDGTTRICIADKVTDVLARIKINTESNTTLATGDYTIKIEAFGSSDGIYYGLVAAAETNVNIKIINFAYGLKVITSDKAKIVNYETGNTQNGSNSLVVTLKYSSSLSNPNIAVSLYRRDYSDVFSQKYNLVDLQDYIETTLTETKREKEYEVSNNPSETTTYFLYLKENLVTGTYKLVYKLYDGNEYVGEAYEYVIIK